MLRQLIPICVLTAALTAPAVGQEMTEAEYLAALEAQLPGELMNNPIAVDWNVYGDGARSRVVNAADIPGQRAYQVRVRAAHANPWDVAVQGDVEDGVAAGDAVLIAVWARARSADSPTGEGDCQLRLQQREAPYAGVVEGGLTLNDAWRIHYLKGRAPTSYDAGDLILSFNVGRLKQTVEFGQYYIMNLGPDADLAAYPSGAVDP